MENFQPGDHGDTKISNAFWQFDWFICVSEIVSFFEIVLPFFAREFWWLRKICGNCWVFWLDFDDLLSLMQAAAVKQEIKEELLQEIGRWLSDWFGAGRPFGCRSIPTCLLKMLFVLMDFGSGTCLTMTPQKVYLKVVSALAQSYLRHVKSSAVQWRVQRDLLFLKGSLVRMNRNRDISACGSGLHAPFRLRRFWSNPVGVKGSLKLYLMDFDAQEGAEYQWKLCCRLIAAFSPIDHTTQGPMLYSMFWREGSNKSIRFSSAFSTTLLLRVPLADTEAMQRWGKDVNAFHWMIRWGR